MIYSKRGVCSQPCPEIKPHQNHHRLSKQSVQVYFLAMQQLQKQENISLASAHCAIDLSSWALPSRHTHNRFLSLFFCSNTEPPTTHMACSSQVLHILTQIVKEVLPVDIGMDVMRIMCYLYMKKSVFRDRIVCGRN